MTITAAGTRHQEALFTRAFVMLAVADLAYFTADGIAIYTLPLYVTGPLASGSAGSGIAFGAFALSALLLRPLMGRLSDVHGRRPLLVGGALLCAISLSLTAAAGSLLEVVALRLLLGVAEAAFFVASFAALADLAPPSRMGEALSYNSLGLYLGLALGPPLGEYLADAWNFSAAWIGAAVLAAMAAGAAQLIGETRTSGEPGTRGTLIHRKAIPVALAFFTSIFAIGGFLAFSALQAEAVGLRNTSSPLIVYGAVVVTCRVAFAKLPDRVPPLLLGAWALATIAGGLSLLASWPTREGLLLGSAVLAVGVSFSTPAFFSAIFATAKPSERGAASGTASAFIDLGLGGGPMVLGFAAELAGIPWSFAVAVVVAIAGCLWTLAVKARPAPSLRPRSAI